ncbi:MAG: S41 family peptidase [Anaerolineae bacterium]
MKRFFKTVIISLSLLIFTFTVFGAGMAFGNTGILGGPAIARAQSQQPPELDVFVQVWNIVQHRFVDRNVLDPARLAYAAINGLVEALGDEGHTRFLNPEEAAIHQNGIDGSFSGIGATLGMEEGLPIIVQPFEGSPAAKAGLQAGDVILAVDGADVSGWSLGEIVEQVRGEIGTEVVLTVFRPATEQRLDIAIIRGEIKVPSAGWAFAPGTNVAVLRLARFSADLDEEVIAAINEAKASGATALIVDVRDNPGGLLQQAIAVTSQFLSDGAVVLEENADGQRRAFPVIKGGIATDLPLVVLTNRGTASSSEIFAGAIQDHERGLVVGETTFGTGTVLQPFRLEDGSVLLLGTSQWLTPNGRLIRKLGLEPDVPLALPDGARALSPVQLETLTIADLLNSEDAQLLKALELLGALPDPPLGLQKAEY